MKVLVAYKCLGVMDKMIKQWEEQEWIELDDKTDVKAWYEDHVKRVRETYAAMTNQYGRHDVKWMLVKMQLGALYCPCKIQNTQDNICPCVEMQLGKRTEASL